MDLSQCSHYGVDKGWIGVNKDNENNKDHDSTQMDNVFL